jgi:crotonobetainyl-CoA:carnitine CoA-transferase CaiB-like acyl-CoA transferase
LERLHGQLPCAPVNDVKAALASEFAAVSQSVQAVSHPVRGEVHMVRQPILIDGEVAPRRSARTLGADTLQILVDAGYSRAEIAALEAEGVIAIGGKNEVKTAD